MTVKNRHAFDDGIGEVHDDVDVSLEWHVYGVQPYGVLEAHSIFGISQEMRLMDMHGVQLPGLVENAPMLVGPDARTRHRSRIRFVLLVVDIETVLIFGKGHDEIGLSGFESSQIDLLIFRLPGIAFDLCLCWWRRR